MREKSLFALESLSRGKRERKTLLGLEKNKKSVLQETRKVIEA